MNLTVRILAVLASALVGGLDASAQRTMVSGSSHWGQRAYTDGDMQTYAAWIRMPATNAVSIFLTTTRGVVVDNHYRTLGYNPGYFYASIRAGGSGYNSQSNGLPAANTWIHVAAIFKGTTNRTVWVNGVSAAAETTTVAPTSIDEVHLARLKTGTGDYFCSADIAEPAIWNTDLSAAELGQLAAGGAFARRAHPSKIRPDKLVWLPDLSIPGAAVPGVGGVTGISNAPALLTALPPAFR